jgi:hypothetical protein
MAQDYQRLGFNSSQRTVADPASGSDNRNREHGQVARTFRVLRPVARENDSSIDAGFTELIA